jgi:2-iminobutanoate/2-iminopropanoate deaminase
MKNLFRTAMLTLIVIAPCIAFSQSATQTKSNASNIKNEQQVQKQTFDPWAWGKNTNSVQAVEVKHPEGTLYCSGQVAIDANGVPSAADMRTQLIQTIKNLEELINKSGYECSGIVRLNVYTTSTKDFFTTCSDIYAGFIAKYGIKQATSLIEVKGLFAAITVELEATVVK